MNKSVVNMEVRRSLFREDHEQLREVARRFLHKECLPKQEAWDAAGRVDKETWHAAGACGLLCTALPTEYGGGGGDFGHSVVVAEEVARSGVSGVGFQAHSDYVAPYLLRLGTRAQKEAWLPDVCTGKTILAIGMTEPGSGSDLKSIRTRAVRDGDEYVINGSKTFISNGLNCDAVVLVCKTDPGAGAKGISLFYVEASRAGFRKGRKLDKVGQRAADTAELFFDDVRVPAGNMLGEENRGFSYLMQDISQERLLIAVSAAAKLEVLLDLTIDYVKQRKAFSQTVWDFQNTRFKLADAKAAAVAVRTMTDYYIAEHMRRKLSPHEAAIAKLYATETMWRCLDDMVQLHGGYGYMTEYPIARAFADLRVQRVVGGTSEVMREVISRAM